MYTSSRASTNWYIFHSPQPQCNTSQLNPSPCNSELPSTVQICSIRWRGCSPWIIVTCILHWALEGLSSCVFTYMATSLRACISRATWATSHMIISDPWSWSCIAPITIAQTLDDVTYNVRVALKFQFHARFPSLHPWHMTVRIVFLTRHSAHHVITSFTHHSAHHISTSMVLWIFLHDCTN